MTVVDEMVNCVDMIPDGSAYFFEGWADSSPSPFGESVGFDAEHVGDFVRGEIFTFKRHVFDVLL